MNVRSICEIRTTSTHTTLDSPLQTGILIIPQLFTFISSSISSVCKSPMRLLLASTKLDLSFVKPNPFCPSFVHAHIVTIVLVSSSNQRKQYLFPIIVQFKHQSTTHNNDKFERSHFSINLTLTTHLHLTLNQYC